MPALPVMLAFASSMRPPFFAQFAVITQLREYLLEFILSPKKLREWNSSNIEGMELCDSSFLKFGIKVE